MNEVFLHIGTLGEKWDGWISVDIVPKYADVCADMCYLPFADDSASCIFTNHTLEHVSRDGALKFSKEAYRVLADGGVICVGVPDILEVAWGLWKAPAEEQRMWLHRIYGAQNYEYDFHRWGYTPAGIQSLFELAGLKTTDIHTIHEIRPTPTLTWIGFKGDAPNFTFQLGQDGLAWGVVQRVG